MHPYSTRPTSPWVKPLALAVVVIVAPILLFMLIEGGSSLFLLALALRRSEQTYEPRGQRHAQPDSELGWVSTPGSALPNMYGPGAGLHIDAQGFRVGGKRDSRAAGSGPLAVCSGDSFTLGVGVADDRTWCAMLESLVPGLTTVNMGQNAYGVDQVYLWYKRDGAKLAHDVQLFAYITDDFRRMRFPTAYGFAKPVLELRNDSLVTTNTPISPSKARRRRYWTRMVVQNELRLVRLAHWVRDSAFPGRGIQRGHTSGDLTTQDSLTWMTVRRVVDDLVGINDAKGSTLVLVHQPVFQEYWTDEADPWRERMRAAAAGGAFVFVDLVEALRRLPADSAEQMFIGFKIPGYADGFGHFSVAGNAWVAGQLHRQLLEVPSFAAKLDRVHPDSP
jgi:hypothetical protein